MRGAGRAMTAVTTAAVLVAGGLTGCSGDEGDGAGTPSSTPSTASPSASVPVAPAGTTWVRTTTSGIRFAVPDDWSVFDAASLTKDRDEATIAQLTKTFGVSEEQLGQVFGQMDLVVVGPPQRDFAPTVNVVRNPLTALPAASELAAELEKIGATAGTPRAAVTPLGGAVVAPYSITSGTTEVAGRSVVLKGPGGFVTITVTHVTPALADAVTSTILSTVSAA